MVSSCVQVLAKHDVSLMSKGCIAEAIPFGVERKMLFSKKLS